MSSFLFLQSLDESHLPSSHRLVNDPSIPRTELGSRTLSSQDLATFPALKRCYKILLALSRSIRRLSSGTRLVAIFLVNQRPWTCRELPSLLISRIACQNRNRFRGTRHDRLHCCVSSVSLPSQAVLWGLEEYKGSGMNVREF